MPLLTSDSGVIVTTGPLLEAEAKEAFQVGYQALANELMYGHMVAEYEDAQGSIVSAQYSPMFKRPTWAVRCGLSIAVRGAEGLTDFGPINESAKPVSGGGFGGMNDRSMAMSRDAPPNDFGPSAEDFAAMETGLGGSGARSSNGRGSSRSGARSPSVGMIRPKMLSDAAVKELQSHVGLVATVLSEQFDKHWKVQHFGSLFAGISAPVPEPPQRGQRTDRGLVSDNAKPLGAGLSEMISELSKPAPLFRPGLIYLGKGPSDEKLEDAAYHEIDLLFHIDVTLKEARLGRNQGIQNVSRLRLFNVRTKKSLVSSRGMDSFEAQQMLHSGRISDTREYVTEQMATVWRQIGNQGKTVKLPKLTPDVAKRRVAKLLSDSSGTVLHKMAEIRLYEALGLITSKEVEGAFYILAGYEGLVLLHGPLDDRRETVRQLAIQAVNGRNTDL